ncbi:MAG: transposase [Bacteroidetes bacterium]|nr:transposase [Bacteroidota bacterium]
MEGIFKEISSEEFNQRFITEEACYIYLAETKWKDGFVCRKCGNTNFCKGKAPHSRRCTRCKKEESATAHTPFHHCKVPMVKAFEMAFTICHSPQISSYELSRREEIRQMTCWKLKKKIMECLEKGNNM